MIYFSRANYVRDHVYIATVVVSITTGLKARCETWIRCRQETITRLSDVRHIHLPGIE